MKTTGSLELSLKRVRHTVRTDVNTGSLALAVSRQCFFGGGQCKRDCGPTDGRDVPPLEPSPLRE